MYVVDMIFHHPTENPRDLGWCFSLTPLDVFVQDQQGWPHSVGGSNSDDFEQWWRERSFFIDRTSEMAQFQIAEHLALELRVRWVGA